MKFEYRKFEAKGLIFHIKYDLIEGEYVPHIFHRHSVTPDEAIETFFNITDQSYNPVNMRYEAYSKDTEITIYYTFKHNKDTEILIITAL